MLKAEVFEQQLGVDSLLFYQIFITYTYYVAY